MHLVADDDLDELDVVVRASRGDKRAQGEFFRLFVQFVGHVAKGAGAGNELEDVVQNTFMSAFAALPSLTQPSSVRAWLARLTVRQVQRRVRWRPWLGLFKAAQEEVLSWESLIDPKASPEVLASVRDVERALATEADSTRLCWLLRNWHGMTLEETAQAADVSLATAKRRLQRADEAIELYRQEVAR